MENPRGPGPLQPLFRSVLKPSQLEPPAGAPHAEQAQPSPSAGSSETASSRAADEPASTSGEPEEGAADVTAVADDASSAEVPPPPPKTPEEEEQEFADEVTMTVALAVRFSPPSSVRSRATLLPQIAQNCLFLCSAP